MGLALEITVRVFSQLQRTNLTLIFLENGQPVKTSGVKKENYVQNSYLFYLDLCIGVIHMELKQYKSG